MTAHEPMRPDWSCRGCGEPWPCQARRAELLAEFAGCPTTLGLLMAGYLVDAAGGDLANQAAGRLYVRFLSWVRPAHRK